ncbi:MAG: hypothetical protein AAGF59_00410, partial [Pseudomonadota bacterium]
PSWALFRGNQRALGAFDASVAGFWRSFGVIVFLIPFYALVFVAERQLAFSSTDADPIVYDPGLFLFWKSFAVAIDWIAFPIVMALLAGPLGIGSRYTTLIVARNWTSLLAILPYAVICLFYTTGLLPATGLALLSLVALVIIFRFVYQVYSAALGGPASLIIGLVIMDFLLSILIDETFSRLSGLSV